MSTYLLPTINNLAFVAYSGARIVINKIYVTGQPSAEVYPHIAAAGIKSVICVRKPDEAVSPPPYPPPPPFDPEREAKDLNAVGVSFTNIPIERTMSQSQFNVAATQAATLLAKNFAQAPALIHCSTGDRASSVFAALLILTGTSNADAIDYAVNSLLLANLQMIGLVQGYSPAAADAEHVRALAGTMLHPG